MCILPVEGAWVMADGCVVDMHLGWEVFKKLLVLVW